jgi:hypothetical protein
MIAAFRGVRFQCSGRIPAEFESAAHDLDKKAKRKFLLQQGFSIQKKYRLVALSRTTPVNARESVPDGKRFSDVLRVSGRLLTKPRPNGGTIGGNMGKERAAAHAQQYLKGAGNLELPPLRWKESRSAQSRYDATVCESFDGMANIARHDRVCLASGSWGANRELTSLFKTCWHRLDRSPKC